MKLLSRLKRLSRYKMRFKIYASEIVYYTIEVDAENEDDAFNQVDSQAVNFEVVNNSGYQIDRWEVIGD